MHGGDAPFDPGQRHSDGQPEEERDERQEDVAAAVQEQHDRRRDPLDAVGGSRRRVAAGESAEQKDSDHHEEADADAHGVRRPVVAKFGGDATKQSHRNDPSVCTTGSTGSLQTKTIYIIKTKNIIVK